MSISKTTLAHLRKTLSRVVVVMVRRPYHSSRQKQLLITKCKEILTVIKNKHFIIDDVRVD